MQFPQHMPAGNAPVTDGQIGFYVSEEAVKKPWFQPAKQVMFINGMNTSGSQHAESARDLSLIQACPVLGIYNRTNGIARDFLQCLRDKVTLLSPFATSVVEWTRSVDAAFAAARAKSPAVQRIDFIRRIVEGNAATVALYDLMVGMDQGQRLAQRIYCHSQGNLITSNALTAVAIALGPQAIQGIEVNSFGSPCHTWPDGLRRTNFTFTFDYVVLATLSLDLNAVSVGFGVSHGFAAYRRHDAEFVVNRFRTGGIGMTVNMDEEGLADYCLSLGGNADRLTTIFTRLKEAHWTDCDDVAEIYVRKMRLGQGALMQAMARSNPGLVQVLIDCLTGGTLTWVSAGEKVEAEYLKGLL